MSSTETAPRRGRDGPAKGDRREQALVLAAEQLLAEGRFTEASVGDLALSAGISRATFYFYFASKEALLATVLDRAVGGFNARIAAVLDLDRVTDPAEALRASVRSGADLWWEHRDVLVAAFELSTRVPAAYARTQADFAVVRSPTVALLQRYGRVPEARDPVAAAELVTVLVLMMERSFYDLMRGEPTTDARDRLVERLSAVWLRAFGLDPAG